MKKNKKAIFYPITILIFTIFILIVALTSVINRTNVKDEGGNKIKLGEQQIELIKTYQKGETALFYVDQSAKYSVYEALYSFAKNGTYFNTPMCSPNSENDVAYIMWENIIQDKDILCYPTERDIAINFALFLNNQLDRYFEVYPSAIIPKNNYDFNFKETENNLEILGIATQNIIISTGNSDYSLKPSFKIETSYRFISKFNEYVKKSQEIRDNMQDCLREGSGTADDDKDLVTCSDINKLKKEIEGIENYQVIPIAFPKNYTLLFDIEDPSFNNPYSDEKLTIKYGIRFLDKFPPPPTEVSGVEERTVEGKTTTYLTWYKNHASDVESYDIYHIDITDKLGGGEIPEKPPTDINKMTKIEIPIETKLIGNEVEWQIDYENTALKKGQKYYFYIRVKDNANNFVKNIDIEPVKITI